MRKYYSCTNSSLDIPHFVKKSDSSISSGKSKDMISSSSVMSIISSVSVTEVTTTLPPLFCFVTRSSVNFSNPDFSSTCLTLDPFIKVF